MADPNRKSPLENSVEKMLESWLEEDKRPAEFLKFRPEPRSMADMLERAASRCIRPWTLKLMKLQDSWQEIVGPDVARKCAVSSVENGIIYVEVRHPAFLTVLNTPKMRSLMLEKIQAVLPPPDASEIKFIAAGGRSSL